MKKKAVINSLIDKAVVCSKCGARGVNSCACWVECPCGWLREDGFECDNPECFVKKEYKTFDLKG